MNQTPLTGLPPVSGPLANILNRVSAAATRAGRDPAEITLIAVSKGQPVTAIRTLHAQGVTHFGESYLQEALGKLTDMDNTPALPNPEPAPLCWHFIGRLQSNKTRPVAERFAWVHSVDRAQLARRLNEQRPFHAPPLNLCLQVHLGDEASKGGVLPAELPALADEVARLERLRLRGLMCIPPQSDDPAQQRRWFDQLRELKERLNAAGHRLDCLSMGMSADFEAAIAAGATHVRIGTALFGPRQRNTE
jgi:pyridoxal phosphate enzyme (YggS family)